MKTLTLTAAAAVIALTACSGAYAASEWKKMDTAAGEVFADDNGMTLYTFRNDTPGVSNCYDSCADAWPPFIADAGATDKGAWTLVTRTDGSQQWALGGMPLYFWAGDAAPGDVTGDGVGGVWDAARPADKAKAPATTAGTGYTY